jgi:uncharacterized protein YkwD
MRFPFACAVLGFALASAGAVLAASAPAPARAELNAEAAIKGVIDGVRARRAPRAPHLDIDPVLTEIARARSRAIADGAPFSHQDSAGRYPAIDMVTARFGPYVTIGENLFAAGGTGRALDPKAYAERASEEWMASQEHRENILSPDYNATGIGVVVKGDAAYTTQLFRGPPPKR